MTYKELGAEARRLAELCDDLREKNIELMADLKMCHEVREHLQAEIKRLEERETTGKRWRCCPHCIPSCAACGLEGNND